MPNAKKNKRSTNAQLSDMLRAFGVSNSPNVVGISVPGLTRAGISTNVQHPTSQENVKKFFLITFYGGFQDFCLYEISKLKIMLLDPQQVELKIMKETCTPQQLANFISSHEHDYPSLIKSKVDAIIDSALSYSIVDVASLIQAAGSPPQQANYFILDDTMCRPSSWNLLDTGLLSPIELDPLASFVRHEMAKEGGRLSSIKEWHTTYWSSSRQANVDSCTFLNDVFDVQAVKFDEAVRAFDFFLCSRKDYSLITSIPSSMLFPLIKRCAEESGQLSLLGDLLCANVTEYMADPTFVREKHSVADMFREEAKKMVEQDKGKASASSSTSAAVVSS